jgi:HK97 gp10 family phage protein
MPIVYNRIPQIIAGAKPAVDRILAKTAFDTESLAKVYAPVDTGNLMNSIAADKVRDMTWRVTANAEYAIYVELGTRRMDAVPYLEPALRTTWPSAIKAIGKAIL